MSKTTSTPKAPTKRENYTAIRAFLVANNADASLVAAIDHELELLAKRAEKPAKSEEQVNADNALVEAIVATLGNGKAMTVSDMQKNCSALSLTTAGVSCSKITSLLTRVLVPAGTVKREVIKRHAYYSLA